MANRLLPFKIENRGVRGFAVELGEDIPALLGWREYPPDVLRLLGHALAATPMLAADLTGSARFNLQFQHGPGAVKLMVAQVDAHLTLRAMAKCAPDASGDFQALLRGGTLACMLEPGGRGKAAEGYQAVVGIFGDNLAEALEIYFGQSEQLPTRIRLGATPQRFAGLMLQRLPEGSSDDDWLHVHHMVATLGEAELVATNAETLLTRLFAEDTVRVFEPRPIALRCQCSHAQISAMLVNLGEAEIRPVLAEQGQVEVGCEFCGRQYRYGEAEINELFAGATAAPGSGRLQ